MILLILALITSDPLLPNASLTPGCVTNVPIEVLVQHGYTASKGVRATSEKLKRAIYLKYKIENITGHNEVDHLIPLELGGCDSEDNLWIQSYFTFKWNAHTKDKLEDFLHRQLIKVYNTQGKDAALLFLRQVQLELVSNWIQCYTNRIGPN